MMYTEIGGLKIRYHIEGEGDDILLLHGWGCKIEVYTQMIKHLSANHRVIVPDLPGFGESSEPAAPYDAAAYVDFVLAFARELDLSSVTLMGHSNGGRIILKMMERENLPFEIRKIVLIDSAGVVPKKTPKQKIKQRLYKIGRTVLSLKPVAALFPDALENLRRKNGSADYNAASPIMRQTLVKLVNEDMTHLCKKISAPTLLIWGENDTATPLSDGQLFEKLIPGSGLVTVKGAGHYSFLEQPQLVHRVLDSFFGS